MNIKVAKSKRAAKILGEAVQIRKQISELYVKYKFLSVLAGTSASISHADLKRAVDAIHYFGGGWPTENSKGRMEALLDNFAGMYRILHFIGHEHMVKKHLETYGMTVKLQKKFEIEDRELTENELTFVQREYAGVLEDVQDIETVRDLLYAIVYACNDLQTEICKLADMIKDDLRPKVMDELDIEKVEYDRLFDIARTKTKNTPKASQSASNKKSKIDKSVTGFNAGVTSL